MKRLLLMIFLLGLAGCAEDETTRDNIRKSEFRVTVYSGKSEVKSFISTERPIPLYGHNAYEFYEKGTGKFIYVSGTVTVEQL